MVIGLAVAWTTTTAVQLLATTALIMGGSDHPLVGLDSCLIVPHIASASLATRAKMAEMAAANVLAGLRGERLPTPVNPEVYDRS